MGRKMEGIKTLKIGLVIVSILSLILLMSPSTGKMPDILWVLTAVLGIIVAVGFVALWIKNGK